MIWTDFVYGIIGFLCFEGLRLFKRIQNDIEPFPKNKPPYLIILFWVALISGFISGLLAEGSEIRGLLFGYTLPSGMKNLLDTPIADIPDPVDDIQTKKLNYFQVVVLYVKNYFVI